ncbi:MAG TPA: isochorismatase family protein [Methylibium sp.]|nr:isochorismatase family protein [Methylibium sp.]
MATLRTGTAAALLVVDVQVGVMAEAWDAARIVQNIVHAVQRARAQGVPVLWVQHADDELPEGSAPWQLRAELQPAAGEPRIVKRYNSSFEQTPLEDELARLGVGHIVLAGAATNWCIRATAYAALERGYDLTLLQDAHTTGDIELPGGRRIAAADIVAELNVAMRWLSYPGRVNGIATAAAVDFGRPGGAR